MRRDFAVTASPTLAVFVAGLRSGLARRMRFRCGIGRVAILRGAQRAVAIRAVFVDEAVAVFVGGVTARLDARKHFALACSPAGTVEFADLRSGNTEAHVSGFFRSGITRDLFPASHRLVSEPPLPPGIEAFPPPPPPPEGMDDSAR